MTTGNFGKSGRDAATKIAQTFDTRTAVLRLMDHCLEQFKLTSDESWWSLYKDAEVFANELKVELSAHL